MVSTWMASDSRRKTHSEKYQFKRARFNVNGEHQLRSVPGSAKTSERFSVIEAHGRSLGERYLLAFQFCYRHNRRRSAPHLRLECLSDSRESGPRVGVSVHRTPSSRLSSESTEKAFKLRSIISKCTQIAEEIA